MNHLIQTFPQFIEAYDSPDTHNLEMNLKYQANPSGSESGQVMSSNGLIIAFLSHHAALTCMYSLSCYDHKYKENI